MQLAQVVGRATATAKHSSMNGWRLIIVQPLDLRDGPDGDPQIAICTMGSTEGDRVMITADGNAVKDMIGTAATPVRLAVIGQVDR